MRVRAHRERATPTTRRTEPACALAYLGIPHTGRQPRAFARAPVTHCIQYTLRRRSRRAWVPRRPPSIPTSSASASETPRRASASKGKLPQQQQPQKQQQQQQPPPLASRPAAAQLRTNVRQSAPTRCEGPPALLVGLRRAPESPPPSPANTQELRQRLGEPEESQRVEGNVCRPTSCSNSHSNR
jgi:hypothetical protein